MVKLLACGARGTGFDSWSLRYDFRDWLSLLPSCSIAEISLKQRKSTYFKYKLLQVQGSKVQNQKFGNFHLLLRI